MATIISRREALVAGAMAALLPSCATRTRLPDALAWQKLPAVPYRGKQDDIAFGAPDVGWYGNGKGLLYATRDAGNSWAQIWSSPGTYVRALGFFDELNGVMGNVGVGSFPGVTDSNPLYRTVDGGRSWHPAFHIDGPRPAGICGIDIVESAYGDRGTRAEDRIVHAAGRVGGPAHYLRSRDGGASWKSRDLSDLTAAIYDVKFLGRNTGFLAGSSHSDLSKAHALVLGTEDGGDSWQVVYRGNRPFETVWKLHFPSEHIGYGTIQSYNPDSASVRRFVAKTVDGGRSWFELPLVDLNGWRSFGIGFATETLGWVGGNLGGLETRDGGESWSPVEIGKAVNKFRFVEAPGTRRVYAIGSEVHRLVLPAEG